MMISKKTKWLRLIVGCIGLTVFAFIIIPQINLLTPVKNIVSSTKENDINASSLFYTEVELASESENFFMLTNR